MSRGMPAGLLPSRLAAGALIVLVLAGMVLPGSAPAGSAKDSLVIGLGTNIATPDNHKLTGLPAIGAVSQAGDFLVLMDANSNVTPWLATSWESADGGKSLILTLRDNVKMHDGNILKAEDVRYSIERFRKLAIGRAALNMVTAVTVVDDRRVKLTTQAPFSPLLRTLAYPGLSMYSKAAIEKYGDDEFRNHVAGPGPYRVTEFKAGDKMVLTAFDQYWAGKPAIKTITFRMMPEMSARILALESGDVDLIDAISPQETDRLVKDSKLQIVNPPSAGFVRIYVNMQKGPLTDKRLRQAVAYAIDREAIVKSLFRGRAEVARSLAPPGVFGYTGDYDVYKYNPAKARELLKQAGVTNLKFTLLHSPGRFLLSTEVVETIKANLAAVGIDMTIQNLEWGAFSSATSTKLEDTKMEASLSWWRSINGDADSAIADFATKFFPPGNNTSFFSNAQYDKLYDQEQAETNQARREQQLKEMQKILMEEMPAVPLYRQPNLWVAGAGLTNFEISPLSCLQPLHKASFK
jgi:peptide/nickel transport system substrate-binding protein